MSGSVLLNKYYLGDQMIKSETDRTHGMHGRKQNDTGFWHGNVNESDSSEDLSTEMGQQYKS